MPTRDNPFGQGANLPFITPAHCSTHSTIHRRKYHHWNSNKWQGPQPISYFQERSDQAVKAREVTGPQKGQEIQDTPGPKHGGGGSDQWLCLNGDCDKKYGRLQELKRHIRDKHKDPPECLFCDTTWTRPEMMRRHLVVQHQDHLTEEERNDILKLRGWKGTIRFLEKCKLRRWGASWEIA